MTVGVAIVVVAVKVVIDFLVTEIVVDDVDVDEGTLFMEVCPKRVVHISVEVVLCVMTEHTRARNEAICTVVLVMVDFNLYQTSKQLILYPN